MSSTAKARQFTFRKAERLCSKKRIEALFAGNSHSLSAYPLRAVYRAREDGTESDADVQLLISVSKRRFKHAVDRNHTKRLIREAYRLNKQILCGQTQGQHLDVAFIWTSDQLSDFQTVESRLKNLLHRIAEALEKEKQEA